MERGGLIKAELLKTDGTTAPCSQGPGRELQGAEMAPRSRSREEAVGERRRTQAQRAGLSVSMSAHQPQASSSTAMYAGQVKPFNQLNHGIYSNCIVIVPKEPGSNELDIIKILMPSFHS